MIRVGLTGGIGSGKSTVSRVFASLGVPVYYTDPEARALMERDPQIIHDLTALLGGGAYRNGQLDKEFIASRIFTDRDLIREVNAIVHPRVAKDFERWAAGYADVPYVVMECAILFESGFDELVDFTVAVSADLDERVARASSRDGIDPAHVLDRIANQMTDPERETHADFTILNSDHDLVVPSILELHKFFTDESRR